MFGVADSRESSSLSELGRFKSGVKGRGRDRWWERMWWLWWGDMRRTRWTRRRVNTMRLTEWRRELIPQVMSLMTSCWCGYITRDWTLVICW